MKALKFLAVSVMMGGLILSNPALAKTKKDSACKGFYVGKSWVHEQTMGLFGVNSQVEEMKIVDIDKETGEVSVEVFKYKKYEPSVSGKESYDTTCQKLRSVVAELEKKS